MQRITKDRLPSTTHRVGKPRHSELRPISALVFHTRTTAKYHGDDYPVA